MRYGAFFDAHVRFHPLALAISVAIYVDLKYCTAVLHSLYASHSCNGFLFLSNFIGHPTLDDLHYHTLTAPLREYFKETRST